jgi:cellulose 1,4-beta-cellobiosidase
VRTHYDNPFTSAKRWYVNELWAEKAKQDGGAAVAQYNTGIWLDSISAIEEYRGKKPKDGLGLRGHLDAALAQNADLIQLVLHNLPGRNCSAEYSVGELGASQQGMNEYKQQYIDRIARILGEAKYAGLRVVAVVEYDALSNLTQVYTEYEDCKYVSYDKAWGYHEGIRYALTQLAALDNVHLYMDVAHSGRLGWDINFTNAVHLMAAVVQGGPFARVKHNNNYSLVPDQEFDLAGPTPAPGWGAINGFISNVADYVPLEEPYLNPNLDMGGIPLRSAIFYDWSNIISEHTYGVEWLKEIRKLGAPARLGMLVDTSRNGWGGPKRPTEMIKSGDSLVRAELDKRVDAARVDKRPHRSSKCNQAGAGLGERPVANPKPGFHAYVWTKPPGESDGHGGDVFDFDPTAPNRKMNEMCDPQGQNHYAEDSAVTEGKGVGTGALPKGSRPGDWFSVAFRQLLENAYPKL